MPRVPGNSLPVRLAGDSSFRDLALALAGESATQQDIADVLGVSPSTVARALAIDPQFQQLYDETLYKASVQLLEKLRTIPDLERDVSRARLKCDALSRYLELRWPERYGKRIEHTHKFADLGGALARGKARAEALRHGITVDGECEHVE